MGSMSAFPTYCLFLQFTFFESILNVFSDGRSNFTERFGHLSARQPNGFLG